MVAPDTAVAASADAGSAVHTVRRLCGGWARRTSRRNPTGGTGPADTTAVPTTLRQVHLGRRAPGPGRRQEARVEVESGGVRWAMSSGEPVRGRSTAPSDARRGRAGRRGVRPRTSPAPASPHRAGVHGPPGDRVGGLNSMCSSTGLPPTVGGANAPSDGVSSLSSTGRGRRPARRTGPGRRAACCAAARRAGC